MMKINKFVCGLILIVLAPAATGCESLNIHVIAGNSIGLR